MSRRSIQRNRFRSDAGRAASVLLAAALGVACGSSLSCSRHTGKDDGTLAGAGGAHVFTPDTRAMNAPAPPGLDPALAMVIPESDDDARLSLDEAVTKIGGAAGGSDNGPQGEDIVPDTAERDGLPASKAAEALRLYAQGRVARLTGDHASAVRDLQAAARIDPSPSAVWRELGEAELASGNRAFAAASFARALERDPDDARALEQNSRIALERRDYARVATLTARLLKRPLGQTDPALPYIAWSQLARSLASLGYVGASAEAALKAADLPARFEGPTSRESELNALYRQRGDTLRDAGDAMLRLGRFEEAAAAFEAASLLPMMSPAALAPRRVYAAMKLGDSAAAAAMIVEQIEAANGRADEVLLSLVGHVSAHTSRGSARIIAGLDGVESTLTERERSLAASSLVRCRAAASDTPRALARLRARLISAPADEDALRDLLSRLRGAPADALMLETLTLVEAWPMQERRYGAALARELGARAARAGESEAAVADPWAGLDESKRNGPAARLLRARLLASENKPGEALETLESIPSGGAVGAAAALARVSLLMPLGKSGEADALLSSLPEDDALVRYAKGLALSQRGDDGAALEVLGPLLDPDAPLPAGLDPAELFVSAAQMSVRRGEVERARDLLERALAADPLRDDAYVGLVTLYAPGQALADEKRLVETIRRMRDANPSSRSLRWLRAQESLARGQFDLAERDLADLAEESPTQPEIVAALNEVWLRTGSTSKAESWFRAKAERFPDASVLVIELADAITAQGRLSEAERVLADRLALTPGDAGVSRALERLYRDKLNEREKADALARKRLAGAPATADTLLEQADLAWREQRIPEASGYLRDLLERFPRVSFRPDQAARVSEFILVATEAAIKQNQLTASLVELVNALTDAAPSAGYDVQARRLLVSGLSGLVDAEKLLGYLEDAGKKFPRRAEELVLLTADAAWQRLQTEANVRLPKVELELAMQARARGLKIIEQSPRLMGKVTPRVVLSWLNLASINRAGASFVEAINRAKADGVFEGVIASMDAGGNPRQARNRSQADNAYQLAGLLTFLDQDAAAEEMLRTALKYDPRHAASNNDLGYRLLVADREVDAAAAMIELAVQQDPNRASYVDSLGWARYKQGIIFDDADPATGLKREGAVVLLSKALDLLSRENNAEARAGTPIMVDHLGDSVWAAGDHETAVRHWELAAQDAENLLQLDAKAMESDDPDDRENALGAGTRKELEHVLSMARQKAVAARAGEAPPVSKMHAPANQPGGAP